MRCRACSATGPIYSGGSAQTSLRSMRKAFFFVGCYEKESKKLLKNDKNHEKWCPGPLGCTPEVPFGPEPEKRYLFLQSPTKGEFHF